ncbi:MAG: hypothetical protein JW862_19535 [Anaerolineales bacterium]|nr:hypothetical protein [Anaerolineales bacterium]
MESNQILNTKLYIPQVRSGLVARPRLIVKLQAGINQRLTLISAPAGFGKTTLLSAWAHDCGCNVAWLALDEGENDQARFLAYLIGALQTIYPDVGKDLLSVFQTPQPPPLEILLTTLINEISETKTPSVLVLDDYHTIAEQAVHEALAFFLEHSPPSLHLVIATRSDPPLPIPRLRGRGQINELRAEDLRFTPEEISSFFNKVMCLGLSEDDVTSLGERTEGWAAGLQMAAVSLQGHENPSTFIQAFTGSNQYILEYLIEEVVERQPQHIQDFLLKTSILEELSPSLCDAITERDDSRLTLDEMERANLFILPITQDRRWYRYHHLFAELLQQQLRRNQPELLPVLHQRAGDWYLEREQFEEAIEYTLKAGDFERAAELIEESVEVFWMRSEVRTFLNWVETIPEAVMRERPLLCVFHALALYAAGEPIGQIESRLDFASETNGGQPVSGEVAVFRGLMAAFQGDVQQAIQLSEQALGFIPADNLFLRSLISENLGLAYIFNGELEKAIQTLNEAITTALKSGNLMIAVLAYSNIGELQIAMGNLQAAKATFDQAMKVTTDEKGEFLPVASMVLSAYGELYREWNQLDKAIENIETGLKLTRRWGDVGAFDGYINMAQIKQAQGDSEAAFEYIEAAHQLAVRFDATDVDDIFVDVQRVRLWARNKNYAELHLWMESGGFVGKYNLEVLDHGFDNALFSYQYVMEQAALAQMQMETGELNAAHKSLGKLLLFAEHHGWGRAVIEVQTLHALVDHLLGNDEEAYQLLEEVLARAAPENFVRTFIEIGEELEAFLLTFYRQLPRGHELSDYVGKLLLAFQEEKSDSVEVSASSQKSAAGPMSTLAGHLLVEELSEREIEVLELIANGYSNKEIADTLYIALSTVKSHINNIYRKLDVSKRTQAVARARELSLL